MADEMTRRQTIKVGLGVIAGVAAIEVTGLHEAPPETTPVDPWSLPIPGRYGLPGPAFMGCDNGDWIKISSDGTRTILPRPTEHASS